jgi:hypothetical protein
MTISAVSNVGERSLLMYLAIFTSPIITDCLAGDTISSGLLSTEIQQ